MSGLKKSPWVIHYDASSCNGCDIEVLACLTPGFDVERFGIINTGNPKHADIFLITGAVNEQNRDIVRNIYEQMPEPKVVVALGICATTGGIFRECYNVCGGVDTVIPVDVYVPGCAVRPEVIIDGVVKALGILEEKHRYLVEHRQSVDKLEIMPAEKRDAPEILALQKISFKSDAEIYNDDSLPVLRQTLDEMNADFDRMLFLKGVINGKIVASVRGYADGETAHIIRPIVHPYFQGHGTRRLLVTEMEKAFPRVRRFEVFTGDRSVMRLGIYGRLGYKQYKTERYNDQFNWIYLEKFRP